MARAVLYSYVMMMFHSQSGNRKFYQNRSLLKTLIIFFNGRIKKSKVNSRNWKSLTIQRSDSYS